MNQFYREKPFMLGALAPVLIAYGIIGIISSMGKSNEAQGIMNLINTVVGLDAAREKRVLMFLSIMRIVSGFGLWQLKIWGAVVTVLTVGFSIYLESRMAAPNEFALALYAGIIFVVLFHFRDYD